MKTAEARETVKSLGAFTVEAMSGGYVALSLHGKQVAAWLSPDDAVEMAKNIVHPDIDCDDHLPPFNHNLVR